MVKEKEKRTIVLQNKPKQQPKTHQPKNRSFKTLIPTYKEQIFLSCFFFF